MLLGVMQQDIDIDANSRQLTIAAAIPTFGREKELIATVSNLLQQRVHPTEILVLDQNAIRTSALETALSEWAAKGAVRWIQLGQPCIPAAMIRALLEARADIVLFLDDDVVPDDDLISAHLTAHDKTDATVVAGRVIQPWQRCLDFSDDETFHFASLRPSWIDRFMGGNFSIRREVGSRLGGFDENFVQVAYNFEDEFAYRLRSEGFQIYFEPGACVHHLKVPHGGTRGMAADHRMTWKPSHSVGAYYCAMRTNSGWHRPWKMLRRFLRSFATRHHFLKPWWIPATLTAEVLGLIWAIRLAARGPLYIDASERSRWP